MTPFPPSKNRPRPGDWTCPSCGFSNFQRRTACFRCSFPAMGAGPDPYGGGSSYGMQPTQYGGQQGYGHPGMMGAPHMHGNGYGGNMGGMGGGSSGRGGIVPFRAGDWKCGNEGCGYHNFAKNVSCLRCGASRSNAAIIADNGMTQFPGGGSYGGGPQGPPSMAMGSMDSSSYGGMTPSTSAYGAGGMGGNMGGGGYGGQSFGPPSTYALPSGLGGGAPSSYMQQGGYSQQQMGGSNGSQMPSHGGFDSRAEQAFNQGNSSTTGGSGAGGYSNGSYSNNAAQYNDSSADLSFLNHGMNNMGLGDREPRNGQGGSNANNSKSPQ